MSCCEHLQPPEVRRGVCHPPAHTHTHTLPAPKLCTGHAGHTLPQSTVFHSVFSLGTPAGGAVGAAAAATAG